MIKKDLEKKIDVFETDIDDFVLYAQASGCGDITYVTAWICDIYNGREKNMLQIYYNCFERPIVEVTTAEVAEVAYMKLIRKYPDFEWVDVYNTKTRFKI